MERRVSIVWIPLGPFPLLANSSRLENNRTEHSNSVSRFEGSTQSNTFGRGVARMKGRYYYFCSGGSIFTVSTVSRRGRSRMGKYMKKAKSVQNMEVSQSSLVGVRTRARARCTSESICKHTLPCSPASSKPSKSSQSTPISSINESQYMQLRSRRLEKFPRRNGEDKELAEERCNWRELQSANDKRVDQDSAIVLSRGSMSTDFELRFVDERLVDMPARNSCSSRPAFVSVGVPFATSFGTDEACYSRVSSPAQSSFPASSQALVPPNSYQVGALAQSASSRMITRHLKHEADSKLATTDASANVMKMETHMGHAEGPCPSGNIQRESEVGQCFGESPTTARPCIRERTQGPSTRSQKRECPPDGLCHCKEAPELLCRTGQSSQERSSSTPFSRLGEAVFSMEIEAFFANAEQMERRRFIERYNFDPLTERPLKGRYTWLKE